MSVCICNKFLLANFFLFEYKKRVFFNAIMVYKTPKQGTAMALSSNKSSGSRISAARSRSEEFVERLAPADALQQDTVYLGMKLIPWSDVWKSLRTAKFRGNGEMIQVFYETLFKEAVFDDRGAWSLENRRLH